MLCSAKARRGMPPARPGEAAARRDDKATQKAKATRPQPSRAQSAVAHNVGNISVLSVYVIQTLERSRLNKLSPDVDRSIGREFNIRRLRPKHPIYIYIHICRMITIDIHIGLDLFTKDASRDEIKCSSRWAQSAPPEFRQRLFTHIL